MERNKPRDPLPEQFTTIEEAAEFWDTHDLTDYWDLTEDVDFVVNLQQSRYLVALAPELAKQIATQAYKRGLSTETLINIWLTEKLQEALI